MKLNFQSEVETNLHEAEAYASRAAELYERARMLNDLATLRLCRDAQSKAIDAMKLFMDATANPPRSIEADFLRMEGLSLMTECDWTFFDIEHSFRRAGLKPS